MKIELDENIPASAVTRLSAIGHDVDTVKDEGLVGQPDDVWTAAQADERFLVTHDRDFSDVRKFAPGSHHGILLVRLPDAEQRRVADYLVGWFTDSATDDWRHNVVVATPSKVRVLRPKSLTEKSD